MIRRLVEVLVAFFVAWLAAGSSDEATAAPSSPPRGYVYDDHHRSVEPDDTASELGPPSTTYNDAAQSDVRGFLGDIDGNQVALFVYKEGPYQGQLASSLVPSANQLKMWGVP